jgi:hypothetical protein
MYLQKEYIGYNMASASAKRQILQHELDLMEVDAPQAAAQKRTTGKDTTLRTTKGKKSKPDKAMNNISVPDQRLPRYWLGFNYME